MLDFRSVIQIGCSDGYHGGRTVWAVGLRSETTQMPSRVVLSCSPNVK